MSPLGAVIVPDGRQLDLFDPGTIRAVLCEAGPGLIVDATYTAVVQVEKETELVTAINGAAPGVLAEQARRLGAALVHYSTDCLRR